MSDATDEPLDPAAARFVSRVRFMMAISGATTLIAIAAVLGVIGYRVFKAEGSAAEATALLPKGARVIATAATEDRLVVTVDVNGSIEVHAFDLKTLKRVGRLRFATEP
ncbi:MAG: hypothetical protein ACJ8E5_22650 [Xanthobacteraceae bacterium]